jgi:hypothetical protein
MAYRPWETLVSIGSEKLRVDDITDLHVGYARAQMNRGAVPLPPIKPKRASLAHELQPAPATRVELESEAKVATPPQPLPATAVIEAETINVETAFIDDTAVIGRAVPLADTPFVDLPPSVRDPAAVIPEPMGATPGTPKNAIRASYLAIAAAIGASVVLLTYQIQHTHPQASEPARKVATAQSAPPRPVMTIPVVPTGASAVSALDGSNLPYDNVAPPESGTQMNAAPARPVPDTGQHQSIVLRPPAGVAPRSLTGLDLMPDSPKPDFVRPASGLAHVDPREFAGHQSRAAETDTRVVTVQADGNDDARPSSVYEAPIRKVIRTLHRMVQPAREASAKTPATAAAPAVPAAASEAAARHPTTTPIEADGDQRLF